MECQGLLSNDILAALKTSETSLTARLDAQDAQLETRFELLSTDIPRAVNDSHIKIVDRLDAQHKVLEKGLQIKEAQMQILQATQRDGLRARLLDALAFPEMNERRNMIQQRAGDLGSTCHWLLDPYDKRHTFVGWLQNYDPIYWISGKLGSGKSTLLDFICQSLQEGRTGRKLLESWTGPTPLRVLSFWFFRPASSVLLKSIQGFWRSLCFQILDADAVLLEKIRINEDGTAPQTLLSALVNSGSRTQSWTDNELESWFQYLLRHSCYKFLLVVDGLDEMETQRRFVPDLLKSLPHDYHNIKICCSSRPENPFLQSLGHFPSLRLEVFNWEDISNFCRRKLANTRALEYAGEIAWRAERVFLWAALVAEDLRTAAENGDDDRDLKQRLAQCPGEISDLFRVMLQRQDGFYRTHSKPYLRLIDVAANVDVRRDTTRPHKFWGWPTVTLFDLLVASEEQAGLMSKFRGNLHCELWPSLNAVAANLEANIVARCAGLVEVFFAIPFEDSDLELPEYTSFKDLHKATRLGVRFIHRSAQDFVRESEEANLVLESCNISDADAAGRLTIASALCFLFETQNKKVQLASFSRALQYSHLVAEAKSWTNSMTIVMDSLFIDAASREFCWIRTRPFFSPQYSAELSLLQNVTFIFATVCNLNDYIQVKLQSTESKKLAAVAALILCVHLRNLEVEACEELLSLLKPYLIWSRGINLNYTVRVDSTTAVDVPSNASLCSHAYTTLLNTALDSKLCRKWGGEIGAFGALLGPVDERKLFDAWMVLEPASMGHRVLFPEPHDISAASSMLSEFEFFKIPITPKSYPKLEEIEVSPIQWSPRGLAQFLDLQRLNNILILFIRGFRLARGRIGDDDAFPRCLAAVLNTYLDKLMPEELAKRVWCHRFPYDYPYVQFLVVEDDEISQIAGLGRLTWEEEVCRLAEEDPREIDPIMREIIKLLESDPQMSPWTQEHFKPRTRKIQRMHITTQLDLGS